MSEFRVAIDPGHGLSNVRSGRFDPGAIGQGLEEHQVTLEYALTLKFFLTQMGVDVFLTRSSDTENAPVGARDDRASAAGCTHFVSLHTNASVNPLVRGTEIFYRDAADFSFATRLNRALRSARVALGPDRGVRHERMTARKRLAVLDFRGPACLVELGFISNKSDAAYLRSREGRIAICKALASEIALIARP